MALSVLPPLIRDQSEGDTTNPEQMFVAAVDETDGSDELQRAIFEALSTADPPIAEGRIYDHVPADVALPYVQIGETDALADDVVEFDGLDEYANIHVWSEGPGKVEAKRIIGQIRAILHNAALNVVGRSSAYSWVRDSRVFFAPDGMTTHGVVTLRVLHHQ